MNIGVLYTFREKINVEITLKNVLYFYNNNNKELE